MAKDWEYSRNIRYFAAHGQRPGERKQEKPTGPKYTPEQLGHLQRLIAANVPESIAKKVIKPQESPKHESYEAERLYLVEQELARELSQDNPNWLYCDKLEEERKYWAQRTKDAQPEGFSGFYRTIWGF